MNCDGKAIYLDYDHAKSAAKRRRGHKQKRPAMAIYRCDHCRHWHIGVGANSIFSSRGGKRK